MARSTRQAPPRKDPAYAGKRIDDKPTFWAAGVVDRLTGPLTLFAIVFFVGISAVFLRYGEARAIALMAFLRDYAVEGLAGIFIMATLAVLGKVPQVARFERRQAATQQEVEQARAASERVLEVVESQPAAAPQDTTTGPQVLVLLRQMRVDMDDVKKTAAEAAEKAASAVTAVSGYGQSLQSIAAGVTAVTGQTPAQRPAEPSQGASWGRGGTGGHPNSYGAPETDPGGYTDELDAVEDWSRRGGSHRALTSQQAAVPGADEEEDWQETDEDDDGPGLPTSQIRGFRESMAREDRLDRAARQAPPPIAPRGPAPIWPGTQPVADDDLPPHIRAARERAKEQMRRERSEYWSNPEEGPQ